MSTDKEKRVEQTLERYGVWVKADPWEAEEGTDFELMNVEDSEDGELPITEEEEKLLGSLETTSQVNDSAGIPETYASKGGDTHSKSPDKLHRIEEKLDALKDEIRNLKDEISGLRQPSAIQNENSEKSGGYFDDEDDETIALTDDELVHILDSADMADGVVDKEAEKTEEIQTVETDTAQSDSSAELDNSGDVAIEPPEVGQETVEHEQSDNESIINLDEIEDMSDEDEDLEEFEEITDMAISGSDIEEDAIIEDSTAYQSEEIGDSQDTYEVTEATESEAFDEGEEVEIGLDEKETSVEEEREVQDAAMREVSLGEFDFDTQMDETTGTADNLPDTESLEAAEMDAAPTVEDDTMGQTVYSDASSENEAKSIELADVSAGDMMPDESDIESTDGTKPVLNEEEETGHIDIELPPEPLDEVEELDEFVEETSADTGKTVEPEVEELDEFVEETSADAGKTVEPEVEELDEFVEETSADAGKTVEPEVEELDVIELDDEASDTSDIVVDDGSVYPPEDTYKELPGTEEVNLDSLEALASDTETTKESEVLSTMGSEEVAVPGIPGELKDEIRDVLKYMDQLLYSLPEEKVREFRRSEHFEAYKKIFEELGIPK